MKKSLYEKIKRLANELRTETRLRARREKGEQLLELLNKSDIRRRLALEATPKRVGPDDPSIAASRCGALSMLWSVVLMNAISVVRSFQSSKSNAKLQLDDIKLPYFLLIACDSPDETFDDAGLDIPKLPKKTVRSVLIYCLSMLADEKAVELGELQMLHMLNHLCSRNHHVGFFAPKNFQAIFEEISQRLDEETEREDPVTFAAAAQVLESLFQSCRTLDIEMNPFISGSIEIIADWCRRKIKEDSLKRINLQVLSSFYSTLASIFYSHPEKSIGPMKRYGRSILSYCKRCYPSTAGMQKDVLNNYILAHIFISQLKGKLQGMIDGDMGDLARATLKGKQISALLDLVMNDAGKVLNFKEGKQGRDAIWSPLSIRQRRHLELIARLMAIAQREYLVQAEMSMIDDPNEALTKFLKVREEGTDEWSDPNLLEDYVCPQEVFVESPFMRYVMHGLCHSTTLVGESDNSRGSSVLIALRNKAPQLPTSPIISLSVICACTQLFPAGECWTSSTSKNWQHLSHLDSTRNDFLYCHYSSPNDLEPILTLLAEMLEVFGGLGGDMTVQSWTLVVLSSLTEAFEALHTNRSFRVSEFSCLKDLWRRIWRILFRSDLRYIIYAESSVENSFGDLVLNLITKIINSKCTDPLLLVPGSLPTKKVSFIYENQSHVWALPTFKNCKGVSSLLPLKLICAVLAVAGLSDSGGDEIDTSLARTSSIDSQILSMGRRKRLIYFCLGCLQKFSQSIETSYKNAASAAMAIFALIDGSAAIYTNQILSQYADCQGANRFQFTTLPFVDRQIGRGTKSAPYQETILNHLWIPSPLTNTSKRVDFQSRDLDIPFVISRRIREKVGIVEEMNADFIPEGEANELRTLVLGFFEDEICSLQATIDEDDLSSLSISPVLGGLRQKSLDIQAVALKFRMSLNLFYPENLLRDKLALVISDSVLFLSKGVSILSSLSETSEFLLVSSDLLRITDALVELSTIQEIMMPVENLENVINVCKSLLTNYFSKRRESSESQLIAPINEKKGLKDWMSDEDEDVLLEKATSFDDSDIEVSSKRKRSITLNQKTKRRRFSSLSSKTVTSAPPDYESAKNIGLILVALDPSMAILELVCRSLLGTELDLDPVCIEGDMDLRLVRECLDLLSSKKMLFHSKAKDILTEMSDSEILSQKISIPVLLRRTVELVRACANPSSLLFHHGNEQCAKAVCVTGQEPRHFEMTEREIKGLIEILKDESKIQNRPYLRAYRMRSATMAFKDGDKVFHQAFDKVFANSFVKNALQDPNLIVRKNAHIAVGHAVRLLDEERTVQSVVKLLPPIGKREKEKVITNEFSKWYDNLGRPQLHVGEDYEQFEAIDASEAMESDSIFCRSIISCSAQSNAVFQKMLVEIMMTTTMRPDLELLCFQGLERIVTIRKYSSVEEMVEFEILGILKLWVEANGTDFPLILTAPNIVRWLMISGWQKVSMESGDEGTLDISMIRQEASNIFISRHRNILIPLLLLEVVTEKLDELSKVGTDVILQSLVTNQKMKAICEVFLDDDVDDDVTPAAMLYKLLRHHCADIQAFFSPIQHGRDKKYQAAAILVMDFLRSFLQAQVVEERASKKSRYMVTRIFNLVGSSVTKIFPLDEAAYYQAILTIIDLKSASKQSTGDIFLEVGLNATENLVHALLRLDTSNSIRCKSSWLGIKLQCKFIELQIQAKQPENIQLGFCIHVLTEAMLKEETISLQPDILEVLKTLLSQAFLHMKGKQLQLELTPVMQRLIGACMVVHESCQQILLDHCYDKVKNYDRLLRSSCGLVTLGEINKSTSAWGWESDHSGVRMSESAFRDALEQHCNSVENSIYDSVIGTYEVLCLIFENESLLHLKVQTFLSTAPPYGISDVDLTALQKVNKRLCAQSMASHFIEKQGRGWDDMLTDTKTLVNGLKDKLRNKHAWMKVAPEIKRKSKNMTPSLGLLNVDQRLLYAELVQLERLLHSSDLNEIASKDLQDLIRELSFVCGSSCPQQISFAASRCLGELHPGKLGRICSDQNLKERTLDWVETAIDKNNLLLVLQARCMEALGQCLQSSLPSIAMAAAETLGSLFCTKAGSKCWKLLVDKKVQNLLRPFDNAIRQPGQCRFRALSPHEIVLLKRKANIRDEGEMWCWNELIWKCYGGSESSFQEWICRLANAIILCYFKPPSTDNSAYDLTSRSDDFEFIWRCQRMCLLDPGFASCAFQCIIFILLCKEDSESVIDTSDIVSRSFTVLLESNTQHTPNTKALSFAIDSLHLLCRVSLRKFLSRSHKSNVVTQKWKAHKSNFNKNLPPPKQWVGLPFGVIMKIDGITLSRACIQAHRYASGLFFLELHFNAKFGKVGGVFEELSSLTDSFSFDEHADISGQIQKKKNVTQLEADKIRTSALEALSLKAKCLEELNETDALDAIKKQISALNFMRIGSINSDQYLGKKVSLDSLRFLSTQQSFMEQGKSQPVAISECLDALGCHQVVHSYIDGILSNHRSMEALSDDNLRSLREQWFQANLKSRQWDALPSPTRIMQEQTQSQASQTLSLAQNYGDSSMEKSYSTFKGEGQGFYESLCHAIDSLHDEDVDLCKAFLIQARSATLKMVAQAGCGESPLYGVIKLVDRLRTLRDLESAATNVKSIEDLKQVWNLDDEDVDDFSKQTKLLSSEGQAGGSTSKYLEIELQSFSQSIQEIVLRGLHRKHDISKLLVSHIWKSCTGARKGGFPTIAQASLQRLHSLLQDPHRGVDGNIDASMQLHLRLEEARVLESRGDFWGAIRTAKQLIDFLQDGKNDDESLGPWAAPLLTDAQIACGCWMTKYKVQQAKIVLETYLRPGSERARKLYDSNKSIENAERLTHASLEFGETVANLHEALVARVGSLEWKEASMNIALQEQELQRCELLRMKAKEKFGKTSSKSKVHLEYRKEWHDLERHTLTLKRELGPARLEREKIEKSVLDYLTLAIDSITTALSIAATGTHTDLSRHVFRLISLWFSTGKDARLSESVNNLMVERIEQLPTFRFIPLTHQLVSRIEESSDGTKVNFQQVLQRLIFRMSADHPYHLLVPLITLANGNNVGDTRSAKAFLENVGDRKVAAANEIIGSLKKDAPTFIREMLESYMLLTSSYIDLALLSTKELQDKKIIKNVPFSMITQRGSKVSTLDNCMRNISSPPCIITAPPPIRPGADYGDGIDDPVGGERVARFEKTFDLTETGLHRPKIVVCYGSKGGRFRQLVKGDDDLRQDAIMNQVFTYVNGLMMRRSRDHHATNGLKIVTYHVSPLSPVAGVIEWVEDTIPLGNYEEDKRTSSTKVVGAHSKYYPGEWGNLLCRKHLSSSPPDQLRESFDEICLRHSPVLRFFFVERFGHCLQTWHTAKMNFTRSVAISSVVGHILGIGDRHCKNILLREKTGAVVHIDFGIVFEQGKLLNTPERVPFRLTRNLIDGMGPSGVDGTFLSSAEKTLGVLRNNTDALLTILSAVVEDPLYKWNLTPVEARKRQAAEDFDGEEDTVKEKASGLTAQLPMDQNKEAAKAIAKIKEKLQGYEDSTSGEQHGVLGQVLLLVNSAQDVDNLCRMFPGWSPWI